MKRTATPNRIKSHSSAKSLSDGPVFLSRAKTIADAFTLAFFETDDESELFDEVGEAIDGTGCSRLAVAASHFMQIDDIRIRVLVLSNIVKAVLQAESADNSDALCLFLDEIALRYRMAAVDAVDLGELIP